MKEFSCGDVVPGCSARFRGTEEEILTAVAKHAHDEHGIAEVTPALVAQVRAHIRQVA